MAASLDEGLLKDLTEKNRVKCESSTRLSFSGATLVICPPFAIYTGRTNINNKTLHDTHTEWFKRYKLVY